ncbi:MAG: hypothetical protein BroJett018_50530 [Chloroflexota bacterium]|nr:MAG: hypothetical protein BroJett018_50530 [Chloroflexota bacterium]
MRPPYRIRVTAWQAGFEYRRTMVRPYETDSAVSLTPLVDAIFTSVGQASGGKAGQTQRMTQKTNLTPGGLSGIRFRVIGRKPHR